MSTNYIYLLCEREFIKTNEPIYKIGRSLQENLKRIQSYPNGTKLLFQSMCEDCIDSEKELIKLFKLNFIHRNDIGNEYFEGNSYKMVRIMTEYINNKFAENNLFDLVHNIHSEINKIFKCTKCFRLLSCQKRLKQHELKCDGTSPLQCRVCFKEFSSKQGKYQHIKKVKCIKPISKIINNNTTNNTNNNTNNNTTNTTNNITNNIDKSIYINFDRSININSNSFNNENLRNLFMFER